MDEPDLTTVEQVAGVLAIRDGFTLGVVDLISPPAAYRYREEARAVLRSLGPEQTGRTVVDDGEVVLERMAAGGGYLLTVQTEPDGSTVSHRLSDKEWALLVRAHPLPPDADLLERVKRAVANPCGASMGLDHDGIARAAIAAMEPE